jgi:hypothetical protein
MKQNQDNYFSCPFTSTFLAGLWHGKMVVKSNLLRNMMKSHLFFGIPLA